jgi:hypothetical protein
MNIYWFKQFPHGRFANAIFQLVFARYLRISTGKTVALGSSQGALLKNLQEAFGIPEVDDQTIQTLTSLSIGKLTLGRNRSSPPLQDIKALQENETETSEQSVVEIEGYFQYDTHLLFRDPTYLTAFNELLSTSDPENNFKRSMKTFGSALETLFAEHYTFVVHVRREDYTTINMPQFFHVDLDKVFSIIKEFTSLNRINKFLVYIATDDTEYCKIKTCSVAFPVYFADDLGHSTAFTDSDRLLVDLCAISMGNTVFASNSSFSMLGCMLNRRGHVFYRQTRKHGHLVAFDPWATPILYEEPLANF